EHIVAFGLMLGAGCSNLLDRFIHGGVVDMFFWHKGFEFAIFNVADVMINLSVALILIKEIFLKRGKNDRVD
ncbi:signal peptidase II, partial [Campylobacter upsaliensis]